MFDKQFGGMQKAFVNYATEFFERGYPILCVIRQEAAVERMLRENGVNSVQTINNRFGFYDSLAIREMMASMEPFFASVSKCFVLTFGARATYFSGKLKFKHPQWKVVASLPNRINFKYYRNADVLVPSTRKMASLDYHKNLSDPNFSEVIPRMSRVNPISSSAPAKRIANLFAAGRFVRKKGFRYLLQAMSQLVEEHPEMRLKIAGDGPERDQLIKLRNALKLNSHVEFLGFRYDVPNLIKKSDLLIVPSVIEPFGNILLEGMATGTPIVTTRSTGALELLVESTAEFADIASSDSLADAISVSIRDPKSAGVRAANALNAFKLRYTPDIVVPQVISLFRRLP